MRRSCPQATALVAVALVSSVSALADGVLHYFRGTPDGATPMAALMTDANGNLFGAAYSGGSHNAGAVFEMSPNGSGGYTYAVIYSFTYATGNAESPTGSLVIDSSGNLYGVTQYGGTQGGVGTVYELSPATGGGWTERVIHSFSSSNDDGFYPSGGLILDSAGNLYGVTRNGGANAVGTVFELSPDGNGGWTESILYSFKGSSNSGPDGAAPLGGLVMDPAGNLYGTTFIGGHFLLGTVFELSPAGGGAWTEKIIHRFNGADGCYPQSGLLLDAQGNLYGTTFGIGPGPGNCYDPGTVFELSPVAGEWRESILHHFQRSGDGNNPNGIAMDAAGNIYGTTSQGGSLGYGTLFKMALSESSWTEHSIHNFSNRGDGCYPTAGVIVGVDGNLYGTVSRGGVGHAGAVFGTKP